MFEKGEKCTFVCDARDSIQCKIFHFESADEIFGVSEHRLSGQCEGGIYLQPFPWHRTLCGAEKLPYSPNVEGTPFRSVGFLATEKCPSHLACLQLRRRRGPRLPTLLEHLPTCVSF